MRRSNSTPWPIPAPKPLKFQKRSYKEQLEAKAALEEFLTPPEDIDLVRAWAQYEAQTEADH